MNKYMLLVLAVVFGPLLICECLAGHNQQVRVVNGFVVTQFAQPQNVPAYTVTVAPSAQVYYGTGSNQYQQTEAKRMADELAEIKQMLAGLAASGQVKGLSLPSHVRTSCVQCHGDVNPKGGLSLTDLNKLDAGQRLDAVRRILSDDPKVVMPPPASEQSKSMTADQRGKVLQELSNFPVVKPAVVQPE